MAQVHVSKVGCMAAVVDWGSTKPLGDCSEEWHPFPNGIEWHSVIE